MLKNQVRQKRRRTEIGQDITEYACILAFITGVIVMVFAIPMSPLYKAVGSAFSSVSTSVSQLASGGGR